MDLLYKFDWEKTKQRYIKWWNHGYFGRCAIAVYAPKNNPPDIPEPPEPKTIEQQWYDLDWISARQEYFLSHTFFGGEALPVWNGGYPGHTALPTFLGCPITLDWNTGWWEPILSGDKLEFGQPIYIDNLVVNDRNLYYGGSHNAGLNFLMGDGHVEYHKKTRTFRYLVLGTLPGWPNGVWYTW